MHQTAARASLNNCVDTLQGAIWPEIVSGRSANRHGRYYHPRQLHTGESELRPLTQQEVGPEETYWSVASQHGLRVAVVDITQAAMDRRLNGIQVLEWGLHDRTFTIDAHPHGLLPDIQRRYGSHPVHICDYYRTTQGGYRHLLRDLKAGIRTKTKLIIDLLGRESWDLFTFNFSETHCAGHHFWHLHDPNSPWHDPNSPADLKDALFEVYREIDEAVGRVIAAAGDESRTVMLTSHGMGLYNGGYQLMPEIVSRMGLGSDEGRASSGIMRRFNNSLKTVVPRAVLPLVYRMAETGPVRRFQQHNGCMVSPLQSPETQAAALPNNRIGAVRLNLQGREPFGRIAPGAEAKALLKDIAAEFESLVLPGSTTPIIEWARPIEDVFSAEHHPDLPDLLVRFRDDLGVLETCESPRLGRIRVPLNRSYNPRTGDHTKTSRLWLKTPEVRPGALLPEANSIDVAPTVLKMLGVPVPNWMDGQPLPAVA